MNNRKCTLAKRWLFLHDFSSWLNVCFPPEGHLHAGIATIVMSLGIVAFRAVLTLKSPPSSHHMQQMHYVSMNQIYAVMHAHTVHSIAYIFS